MEKRQNIELRKTFNKLYNELSIILPCYSFNDRYSVIKAYIKIHGQTLTDSAKGRLLYRLGGIKW